MLAADNNLSDVSNATAARSNLGVPALGANTYSGSQTIRATGGPSVYVDDASGSSHSNVYLKNQGTVAWGIRGYWSGSSQFQVIRYNSTGALVDVPLQVDWYTGVAALAKRPTFAGAMPWDSANFDPNTKFNKTGDTLTDDIRVKQVDNTNAKGLALLRPDGTTQAWLHGSQTGGQYSAWATMKPDGTWQTNAITVFNSDNRVEIANARFTTQATFYDRPVVGRDGWQADLALQNRRPGVGASTVYLRASDSGGFEVINNAYNAVIWRVDDWGTMYMRGQQTLNTDGNLYCGFRGAWLNAILDDLYNRDNGKANWGSQCAHGGADNEFGSVNIGYAANRTVAGSPWVIQGLRSQAGSNVTFLIACWLRI
ncbi:hypothetical protein [Burkholderia pseudomallei]|uniref:hypothetical protein n=1 Tax=Burkholderia pseudomallei TaxID=28450 RepID=UPI0011C4D23B|nr:hypothetical protein [Burkholderia pseudomallei]